MCEYMCRCNENNSDKPCDKITCKQYDKDFKSNCFLHTLRCVKDCKDFEESEFDSFTNPKKDMGCADVE